MKTLLIMSRIQNEKNKEVMRDGLLPLNSEGMHVSRTCLYTIDNPPSLVVKKADPKR